MWPTSLSLWQKIQSILYPIKLYKGSSPLNPVLELFYFQSRYILATSDAVYSDGPKYRPLVRAFAAPELQSRLATLRNVLVLGTGLASAVHILNAKGLHPKYTLVEIDPLVLEMALQYLPEEDKQQVTPIQADAFEYLPTETDTYDLIIVDIFFGREVPAAAVDAGFLMRCKARMVPEGYLVMNYMIKQSEGESKAKKALEALFPKVSEISFGINKVYIASA